MTFSKKEKLLSKALFEKANELDYNRLITKINTTKIQTSQDIWQLREMLNDAAKEFDNRYDYRYSVVLENFITFILDELISLDDLEFLSDDKYRYVERIVKNINRIKNQYQEENN